MIHRLQIIAAPVVADRAYSTSPDTTTKQLVLMLRGQYYNTLAAASSKGRSVRSRRGNRLQLGLVGNPLHGILWGCTGTALHLLIKRSHYLDDRGTRLARQVVSIVWRHSNTWSPSRASSCGPKDAPICVRNVVVACCRTGKGRYQYLIASAFD